MKLTEEQILEIAECTLYAEGFTDTAPNEDELVAFARAIEAAYTSEIDRIAGYIGELEDAAIALVQRLESDKDVKQNNWWLNERAKIMEVISEGEGDTVKPKLQPMEDLELEKEVLLVRKGAWQGKDYRFDIGFRVNSHIIFVGRLVYEIDTFVGWMPLPEVEE